MAKASFSLVSGNAEDANSDKVFYAEKADSKAGIVNFYKHRCTAADIDDGAALDAEQVGDGQSGSSMIAETCKPAASITFAEMRGSVPGGVMWRHA